MPTLDSNASTSRSLLARAQEHDSQSWQRLSDIYAPVVYRWARRHGVQENDAADVVQTVLLRMTQAIGSFERQRTGSFRAWLGKITYYTIIDRGREAAKSPQASGGTEFLNRLHEIPDPPPEATATLNDERLRIARRALGLLETDFEPHVWQAFWRTTIDGQSAANVADELDMNRPAVYQAKSRVLRRLRTELEGLLD
jgi:RNA polymerase sigma-70 factor (ECF subfamily)